MTRALVGLAAIIVSVTARAEAPPYDFARETAWARSIAGPELRGIRLRSPLAKLLRWVPRRGEVVDVYLFTSDYDCLRVALERRADARDPAAADRLDGTLYSPLPPFEGEPARDLLGVSFGEALEVENEGGMEEQDADGSWHSVNVGTIGRDPTTYGALSSVDDRVARFDGQPLAIEIACLGPIDHRLCATGGDRLCNRCEQLGLEIRETGYYYNYRSSTQRSPGHVPGSSCREPCPEIPSPKFTRLAAWQARLSPWQPRRSPRADIPSLYRRRRGERRASPA